MSTKGESKGPFAHSPHESQGAAGILPANQSEESTAGKMPAAPWRRSFAFIRGKRIPVFSGRRDVVLSQIRLDDLGVFSHLGRRTLGNFHTVIEDGDAFANAHDHLHVMFD